MAGSCCVRTPREGISSRRTRPRQDRGSLLIDGRELQRPSETGGHEVRSITADSVERLSFAEGKAVTAIIKATDVLVCTDT